MSGDANLFTGNCEGASSSNCKGVPRHASEILLAVRLSFLGKVMCFFVCFVCVTPLVTCPLCFIVASVCFCFSVVAAVSG